MIKLTVDLEEAMVRAAEVGSHELTEAWHRYCRDRGLEELTEADLLDVPARIRSQDVDRLRNTSEYVSSRVTASVQHITRFFPKVPASIPLHLRVVLLPFGRFNFGPTEGLQIFSLYPGADPVETYLFLIHVYYHEITSISFTERCARCSRAPETPQDICYWISLLIRNEGIANYAVLKELRRFRDAANDEYRFHYFTYAPLLDTPELVDRSWKALGHMLNGVLDGEVTPSQVLTTLKSKLTPVINVLGIDMAEAVVKLHGEAALLDVFQREPSEFVELCEDTVPDHVRPLLMPREPTGSSTWT